MELTNPETQPLRRVDEAIIDKFITLNLKMTELGHREQLSQTMATVTKGQGRVLAALEAHPRVSQKELVAHLGIRAASVSELINKLCTKGLVTREAGRSDHRQAIITLTPAGRAELRRYKLVGATVLADLTEEERLQLSAIISKLVSSVKLRSTASATN